MTNDLIIYRKFNDSALAEALAAVLQNHSVYYELEEEAIDINPLTALNTEVSTEYVIKIGPSDFTAVDELLKQEDERDAELAEHDHYLFAFTNDQLHEVISN